MDRRVAFLLPLGLLPILLTAWAEEAPPPGTYRVVSTGQRAIFSDRGQLLTDPGPGEPFFGQDAQRQSNPASYTLSGDGLTVRDNVTGLTWQHSPETDGDGVLTRSDKLTWPQARARPAELNAARFGGFSDWRLPTIKELYSLIDFRGIDPSGMRGTDTSGLRPFIDTRFFKFAYGDPSAGSPERIIDSQYASSTLYVHQTRRGLAKLFGVNFADGRIKGYGLTMPGGMQKTFFVQCVRGNTRYGANDFKDNGDKTVTDRATGLIWSKEDSKQGMNWKDALAWAQSKNKANHLGHNDWRLPSVKELQSIVDYTRSPDTTDSAAIDPVFTCTQITSEAGQADYPYYWTATTHGSSDGHAAVYVAFGRAMGFMMGEWQDVHGAGAQRSDPKAGDPANFPRGRGPQGDAIRILNFVRLVRNVDPKAVQAIEPDLTLLPTRRPGGGLAGFRRNGPGAGPGPEDGGPGSPPGPGEFGPGAGPPDRFGGPVGGFHLIPRFAADQMNLGRGQLQQIAELEKATRAKLEKILTPRQMKTLEEARPPGFGPGPPGFGPGLKGPGGPRGGPPAGPGGPGPDE